MAEELIDSFADRAKIADDKQFIVDALAEIYTNFEKISTLKIALSGDASFKDAVATVKQLKTVQDELDVSQRKLAQSTTDYNKQIIANRLATQQNNQALKDEAILNNAAEGSIKQKIILLKQMQAQYDALGTAARRSGEGEGLLKNIKALDAETKALKQDTGRFQEQVGNYGLFGEKFGALKNSIGGALQPLKEFGAELITQAALFVGIYQAFDFLKESVKEYQHAQQEASKLNNILTNIGRKDVFVRLKDQAEDLAKEFKTVKSEDLVGVFDQLVVYGKLTENQIKQLTPVIINFAAQTGKSLEESTSLILKGLEGNGRALKEFGINMKDGKDSAERFGIVMDQLAPKVEGAAKAFGDTAAGQIKKTEVEIDELKKKIGEDLQPVMSTFYEKLSQSLEGLGLLFGKAKDGISDFSDRAKDAALNLKAYFTGDQSDLINYKISKSTDALKQLLKDYGEANKGTNDKLAQFYLEGDKFNSLTLKQQQDKLLQYTRDAKREQDFLDKATKKGNLESIEHYQNLVAVYTGIVSQAQAQLKTVLGTGDPDAGGEAKKRESLINEIKAEAEARLKLIEIKHQEALEDLKVTIDNPNGQSFGRIKAAQESSEIEKKIIKDRLANQLEANRLEREDLKLSYDQDLKAKGVNVAEKAYLTEKYYLQEKTLTEDRQYLIEKADDDIFKKQVEYNTLIIKLHADSLQAERNDELFTQKVLADQWAAYYKAQEDLAKTTNDKRKGYLSEGRDILLKDLDKRTIGDRVEGVKTNDTGPEKKYQEERKRIINEADIFILEADADHTQQQIALAKQKGEDTVALEAKYANIELAIEDAKNAAKLEKAKKAGEKNKELKQQESDLAREIETTAAAFVDGAYERRINGLQDQINANNKLKEASVQRIATETASETTKAAQLEILARQTDAQNEALTRKQNQAKEKQAAFDRDKAIFDVAANTAVAIIKAVADFPETAGEPFAAIAAAIGAVEIAAILAKPLPHYKGGVGLNGQPGHGGGKAVVGDGGRSELAVLPDGSMIVTPNRPTVMDLPKNTVVYPDAVAINRHMLDMMVERTMTMMGIMTQESTASEIRELREEVRWQTVELKRALGKTSKRAIIINTGSYKDSEHIRKYVYE